MQKTKYSLFESETSNKLWNLIQYGYTLQHLRVYASIFCFTFNIFLCVLRVTNNISTKQMNKIKYDL